MKVDIKPLEESIQRAAVAVDDFSKAIATVAVSSKFVPIFPKENVMDPNEVRRVRDLWSDATEQVEEEVVARRREQLAERLREIKAAKLTLAKMERDLEKFLEEPIDAAVFE